MPVVRAVVDRPWWTRPVPVPLAAALALLALVLLCAAPRAHAAACPNASGGVGTGCDPAPPPLPDPGTSGITLTLGDTAYTSDPAAGTIAIRRTAGGTIAELGCVGVRPSPCATTVAAGLAGVTDLAASANGRTLYAVARHALAIFRRNPATGLLTSLGCIGARGPDGRGCAQRADGLGVGTGVAVSADGRSVYAVFSRPGAIAMFARRASGRLTARGCFSRTDACPQHLPGIGDARDVAITPNGRVVLLAGGETGWVTSFRRSAATSALVWAGCASAASVPACTLVPGMTATPFAFAPAGGQRLAVLDAAGTPTATLALNARTGKARVARATRNARAAKAAHRARAAAVRRTGAAR